VDENLKEIGRDLWKDKPLLIAVIVAVAVVAWMLIKNSQANAASSAAPGSGSTLPTGAGGTYVEDTYNFTAPLTSTVTNMLTGLPSPITLPTTTPTTTSGGTTGSSSSHNPGTTFLGPTGVKHYVANGSQTLSQIANHFGLSGAWNAIYSIPDNQKIIGKKNAATLRNYTPKAGTVLTLPGSTTIGF
jgi:hypothetical protein